MGEFCGLDFWADETDRRMRARLGNFVPERVFDAHLHIYDCSLMPNAGQEGSAFYRAGRVFGGREGLALAGTVLGNRVRLNANFVLMPDAAMADLSNGLRDAATQFLAKELAIFPECSGEVVVVPQDTAETIEAQLVHPRIRGLKCYHTLAQGRRHTMDAPVWEYLPEGAWEAAERNRLAITLHLVKDEALSDPDNASYLLEKCRQYPHASLILAHCGRGFAAWTVMDSVAAFREIPNVWFDLAAVCEPAPIFTVIQVMGAERVLWGSDAPVSGLRGRCGSVGREFVWLDQSACPGIQTALVGTEALSAFYDAANMLGLTEGEIKNIFYGNARRLFFLDKDE